MLETIKCGVIGLGWFGEKHCEVLHDLPQSQLHAVCTRRRERLANVAERFGVTAAYTNYHELLANPDVDVVSVVTMWDQHAEPVVAALEAGKHVFLEKPMASTLDDCDRILTAAENAPGNFMVGHICRFNPRYVAAKAEIVAGNMASSVLRQLTSAQATAARTSVLETPISTKDGIASSVIRPVGPDSEKLIRFLRRAGCVINGSFYEIAAVQFLDFDAGECQRVTLACHTACGNVCYFRDWNLCRQ